MISGDTTTSNLPSRHAASTLRGGPPKNTPGRKTLVSITALSKNVTYVLIRLPDGSNNAVPTAATVTGKHSFMYITCSRSPTRANSAGR